MSARNDSFGERDFPKACQWLFSMAIGVHVNARIPIGVPLEKSLMEGSASLAFESNGNNFPWTKGAIGTSAIQSTFQRIPLAANDVSIMLDD